METVGKVYFSRWLDSFNVKSLPQNLRYAFFGICFCTSYGAVAGGGILEGLSGRCCSILMDVPTLRLHKQSTICRVGIIFSRIDQAFFTRITRPNSNYISVKHGFTGDPKSQVVLEVCLKRVHSIYLVVSASRPLKLFHDMLGDFLKWNASR